MGRAHFLHVCVQKRKVSNVRARAPSALFPTSPFFRRARGKGRRLLQRDISKRKGKPKESPYRTHTTCAHHHESFMPMEAADGGQRQRGWVREGALCTFLLVPQELERQEVESSFRRKPHLKNLKISLTPPSSSFSFLRFPKSPSDFFLLAFLSAL